MLAGGLGDALGGRAAVLDGELVVLNEAGKPEFGLMQERRGLYQQGFSVSDSPVRFLVFDILLLPYERRRELLERLALPYPERIAVVASFAHAALAADGLTPTDRTSGCSCCPSPRHRHRAGHDRRLPVLRAQAQNL